MVRVIGEIIITVKTTSDRLMNEGVASPHLVEYEIRHFGFRASLRLAAGSACKRTNDSCACK